MKKLLILMAATAISTSAMAENITFSKIQVNGNKRVETSTIEAFLNVPVGTPVSKDDLDGAFRRMYDTGLFEDLKLTVKDKVLVVDIKENPTVSEVNISGNKESRVVLNNTANPLLALGQVLRRSSLRNLKLSTLVCQVLYNLLLINDSIVELLPSILISGLEELIDCVIEFSCDDNSGNKENKYSDFIKVGNAVMSIINSRK